MKSSNQIAGYDVHPAANLFPMMTDEEFDSLLADIKKHGQIIPIVLHHDKILDGRNRALACHKLGVNLKVINRDEIDDPISWAISANAKRRNLTKSQLGMVAKDSLALYEADAAERKKLLSGTRSNPGEEKEVKERIPEPQARDKAAKAAGVNPRYVSDAKAIDEVSSEIGNKVRAGELTIPEAKRTLHLTAALPKPPDKTEDDEDSDTLFHLKRYYKAATKKDRAKFEKWKKTINK